jgi:hypothetical protein
MNNKPIDDYISEATKNLGTRQRSEVAKELRAHILDTADALAAERKTAVDDAIISEVLARMGPANRMAAMYQKTRSHTRTGRPKIVPPLHRIDLVVEAIALAGFLFNIGLIVYGIFNLPDVIPTHVGPSGGIDSYGSKWQLLVVLFLANLIIYPLLTIASRYPYIFNYPLIITEANAPKIYRLGRSMLSWMKVVFVWTIALMEWRFIEVLPYNPGQSLDSIFTFIPLIGGNTIVIGYFVVRMLMANKQRETTYP